ncbi:MAG: folylpolyglutamate synthase/dihydrofolate synthase family protein [Bryobacteraceae bacterium]|nr:folylpolyglutamate synthase/dihydrofolate synthase family protein [Bryobacteraceae bacterium]
MNYPDSVHYLYALGNEQKSIKFGLERIRALLAVLGDPQNACRFVHVAGTNGKGSTCSFIESALRASGVKTGLYTSPHLVEPTERVQIAGSRVSHAAFAAVFDRVHETAERMLAAGALDMHPTYFETVAAMAFLLFQEAKCERVVLEVGMGGRLDATNIVQPELCVITPIDFDHEKFLGDTIEQIASEKAGILKPGVPAVFARQRPEAAAVLAQRAAELAIRTIAPPEPAWVEEHERGSRFRVGDSVIECRLPGAHQVDNALTAIAALEALDISRENIEQGIAQARWPGRLEFVAESPAVVLDGAHNPAGARTLAAYLRRFHAHRRVWMIFGVMRDKTVEELTSVLFPLAHHVVATRPDQTRALEPEAIAAASPRPVEVIHGFPQALERVRCQAAPDDLIVITGSLYLVGEARALLIQ